MKPKKVCECHLRDYYRITGDKRGIEIIENIGKWMQKWGKLSRPKFRSAAKKGGS